MTKRNTIFKIISMILVAVMTAYEAYSLIFTLFYNISNGYHFAIGSFGIELVRFAALVILLLSIPMKKDSLRILAFLGMTFVSLAFIAKILLNVWRGNFKLKANAGYLIAETALALAALFIVLSIKHCNAFMIGLILICTIAAIVVSPYYIFANLPIIVVGILMNVVSTDINKNTLI